VGKRSSFRPNLRSSFNTLLPLNEAEFEHNTDIDNLTMSGLLTHALAE
jgi:hypothetical protein